MKQNELITNIQRKQKKQIKKYINNNNNIALVLKQNDLKKYEIKTLYKKLNNDLQRNSFNVNSDAIVTNKMSSSKKNGQGKTYSSEGQNSFLNTKDQFEITRENYNKRSPSKNRSKGII